MKTEQLNYNAIGETLIHGEHESGLNIYVLPKKGYTKTYAIFATRFGSVDNQFFPPGKMEAVSMPDGVAHFLEHKLFEQEDGNAFEKYAKTGASANAFTSFNTTAYLFSCTNQFEENLDILLDFVQRPYFTEENVKKEQGIIGQEIRMYDDDPAWRVFFNMLGALYETHPVRKDIAGTVESISHITKDTLYDIYHTFYHPSNMALFVAGDIEPETVFKSVEKNIKHKTKQAEIERIAPKESARVYKKYVEQKLSVNKPLFEIGFKDSALPENGKELLRKELINSILLELIFSKSSKLYQHMYEQGLVNETFSADQTFEQTYGFSEIGGESDEPKKVYETIILELNRIAAAGLNKDDIERAKKVVYGKYLRQFNSVERISHSFIGSILKGYNLLDFYEEYQKITVLDIEKRLKEHFQIKNMALSIIWPNE